MTDINILIKQACEFAAKGDHKKAHELFIQVCEKHPDSASAWCNRGGAAFLAGNREDAELAYTKAHDLDSANREAVLGLARLSLTARKWDDGIHRLNTLSDTDTERDYLLGIAFENKGDIGAAVSHYTAAVNNKHTEANKALQRLFVVQDEPRKLAALTATSAEPDFHLLTALMQALPSAKSRWTFITECLNTYNGSIPLYDISAGIFLHKKEFAYAARTCAAAQQKMPDLKTSEWPSLKECAWF